MILKIQRNQNKYSVVKSQKLDRMKVTVMMWKQCCKYTSISIMTCSAYMLGFGDTHGEHVWVLYTTSNALLIACIQGCVYTHQQNDYLTLTAHFVYMCTVSVSHLFPQHSSFLPYTITSKTLLKQVYSLTCFLWRCKRTRRKNLPHEVYQCHSI